MCDERTKCDCADVIYSPAIGWPPDALVIVGHTGACARNPGMF